MNQRCYGVKSSTEIRADGQTMEVHSYVFRSPNKEMTETDALWDRLNAFQKTWSRKRDIQLSAADEKTFKYFNVTPKGELVVNLDAVSYACWPWLFWPDW